MADIQSSLRRLQASIRGLSDASALARSAQAGNRSVVAEASSDGYRSSRSSDVVDRWSGGASASTKGSDSLAGDVGALHAQQERPQKRSATVAIDALQDSAEVTKSRRNILCKSDYR